MADNLKDTLKKVLASEGKKKFFFAYGAGKRKDKKGDGELAVSGKKPKKADIVAELDAAGDVYEGICWVGNGRDNGDTVYFQGLGKKLSTMIVTKMALTAKHATSRQYDFQMPSPEEETKAAKLADEGGEAPATAHETPPAGNGQDLQARLKALLQRQKAIFEKDPAKKTQMMPFSRQATSLATTGMPGAAEALDKLEAALQAIEAQLAAAPGAAAPGAGNKSPATTTDTPKPASGMHRLNGLMPAIKAALTAGGPNLPRIQTLVAAANGLLTNQDVAQANKVLDELEPLLKLAAVAPAAPSADVGAEFKKMLADRSQFIKSVLAAKGPNAAKIAGLLAQAMASSKPGGDMNRALALLTECDKLATESAVAPDRMDAAAKWERRVGALEPKIAEAHKTRLGEAKWISLFAKAQDLGSEGDFAGSNAILDQLDGLLKPKPAAKPTASRSDTTAPTPAARSQELTELAEWIASAEHPMLEAQSANPDARTALGNLWTFTLQQLDTGDVEKTRKAYDRLEKAIVQALESAPKADTERFGIEEGLVAKRRAELEKFFAERLAAAEAATEAQISSVKKAIAEKVPDRDPEFLASAIQSALDEKYEQVWQDLHKPIESQSATPEEILSLVEKKRSELASDPLVKVLQESKSVLGVDADVSIDFEKLFDDVVGRVKDLAAV